MWQISLYIYLICILLTYKLLNKRLKVIDRKTKEPLDNTKQGKIVLEVSKICYSITWIISLPMLYCGSIKELNK